jgi:NADH-quinone oxidoreductase subunit G
MPRQNEAVNELWICDKGRFGHHFNGSPHRLTAPLVRKNDELVEASWGEALSLVAEKFTAIKNSDGPDALGGIAGARLSNEDLYLFQKFFRRVIGTNNIDHRVGLNAALEDNTAYTVGVGVGTDLGRVEQDTTILVVGSDLDQEAPILYLRVAGASTKRGAHVINAGGRRTKLDAQAQTSLRYQYGTAAYLMLGLLASVVKQGLADTRFVDAKTTGFSDLEKALADFAPDKVAGITGISAGEIDAAAKAFAEAENGIILFGLEAGNDPALRAAVEALAVTAGHAGKPNNGVIAVLPHANSRGAADMGVLPHQSPGYVPVHDAGLSAQEMLGESSVKAMLVAGADPAADSEVYRATLDQLDFLVVQDLFLTETAKLADVVLPAQGVAERDGSFTNLERRVQTFDAGVPAPGQARADWLILTALAGQLGAEWTYGSADGVMAEITETVPLYAQMGFENLTAPVSLERKTAHYIYEGMSFTADVREGVQWSTVAESDEKIALQFMAPAEPKTSEGLILVASRFLYDDGRLLAEADVVKAHITQPQILLSRSDAEKLAVSNGDAVTVSQNGTSTDVPVRITRMLSEGVAVLPRNLAGRPAEKLVGPDGIYTTVKIEKGETE